MTVSTGIFNAAHSGILGLKDLEEGRCGHCPQGGTKDYKNDQRSFRIEHLNE